MALAPLAAAARTVSQSPAGASSSGGNERADIWRVLLWLGPSGINITGTVGPEGLYRMGEGFEKGGGSFDRPVRAQHGGTENTEPHGEFSEIPLGFEPISKDLFGSGSVVSSVII